MVQVVYIYCCGVNYKVNFRIILTVKKLCKPRKTGQFWRELCEKLLQLSLENPGTWHKFVNVRKVVLNLKLKKKKDIVVMRVQNWFFWESVKLVQKNRFFEFSIFLKSILTWLVGHWQRISVSSWRRLPCRSFYMGPQSGLTLSTPRRTKEQRWFQSNGRLH